MRKFYNIFIRGKILIYLLIIFSYFGVRVFLAHNRWNDEEAAVMQKLALYKQQLDRLRSGAISQDTVASIEPGAVAIPSKVFDRSGKLIGEFYTERRSLLNYDDFPKHLIEALIASEDLRADMGKQLNQWVKTRYALSVHTDAWFKAIFDPINR